MHEIHLADMDAETFAALEERARRHHRTLDGEVRAILVDALKPVSRRLPRPRRLLPHTVSVGHATTWSRDEIYTDASPTEPGAR